MTHWYLSTPLGPLHFRNAGRTIEVAKQTCDVTTWKQEGAARRNCAIVNAAPLAHMKEAEVRPFIEATVRVEIVEAEKRRTAGLDEANRLMADLSMAQRNMKLAPYVIESRGVRLDFTVELAAEELRRAQDAMTAGAKDPTIKRWL